jgi:hypothetical protein
MDPDLTEKEAEALLNEEDDENPMDTDEAQNARGRKLDIPRETSEAGTNTDPEKQPPADSGPADESAGGSAGDSSTLGMFPKTYYSIRNAKKNLSKIRSISGLSEGIECGSFEQNDSVERFNLANYRHSYLKRQNISASFKFENLLCTVCTGKEHTVLHRESERFNARELVPQAFVIADQNFPAALPVGGGEGGSVSRLCVSKMVAFLSWLRPSWKSLPATLCRQVQSWC